MELPKYDLFYTELPNAHVMVWSFKWKHIACYVDCCVMSQLDIRHKICYKSPHKDHCTIPGIVYLWCTHCGAQRALREKIDVSLLLLVLMMLMILMLMILIMLLLLLLLMLRFS